jgi:ribulose-5-phosphate 4-epimerase/fuculose-1-phosphate aldolase
MKKTVRKSAPAKHPRPTRARTTTSRAASGRRGISAAEWETRCELAAAYRLAAKMEWTDMLGTHFSARVPGTTDQFLINPYGMLFEEITASSLIKIDVEGRKLSDSPYEVNHAGFVIHSAVHMNRHDAECVMHTHTLAGVGVSTQKEGLLPATQMALTILDEVRYHDYEGVADALDERDRIVQDLNTGGVLILRNHGLLTVGASVGEAYARMFRIERACRFQIAAMSGGAQLNPLPDEVINYTRQLGAQINSTAGRAAAGKTMWAALKRKLEREGDRYRV